MLPSTLCRAEYSESKGRVANQSRIKDILKVARGSWVTTSADTITQLYRRSGEPLCR
jgi:hypothetical protein